MTSTSPTPNPSHSHPRHPAYGPSAAPLHYLPMPTSFPSTPPSSPPSPFFPPYTHTHLVISPLQLQPPFFPMRPVPISLPSHARTNHPSLASPSLLSINSQTCLCPIPFLPHLRLTYGTAQICPMPLLSFPPHPRSCTCPCLPQIQIYPSHSLLKHPETYPLPLPPSNHHHFTIPLLQNTRTLILSTYLRLLRSSSQYIKPLSPRIASLSNNFVW